MLYQWGTFQFQVYPVNVDTYETTGQTEFAKKEILGIQPPRELTGDDDEEITLSGRYHPNKWGGLQEMKTFDKLRKAGLPQQLMRGDGESLGWYSCTRLHQKGTNLRRDGIAQVIAFEATFYRQPVPDGAQYFSKLYTATGT